MIVSSVVLAVTLAIYLFYVVKTRFTFYFVLGNWKFDLVKIVSKYLYFENLDVVTTLTLDKCDDDTAACRAKGFKRLRQRLCVSDSDRVDAESSGIADCRFLKWKLANPLLKALRLKYPNVIEKRSGAYVELPSKKRMMYVSGDAVHFFDETFYEKLREDTIKDSDPRTPITINEDMLDHANTIRKWTGMDRVRYCLSGSEAVDAAFRVARVATGKQIIVRFAKAYHGHSSGVGIGGPNFVYLDAMSESALEYIETYHHKIAGVVINPMDRFTGVRIF